MLPKRNKMNKLRNLWLAANCAEYNFQDYVSVDDIRLETRTVIDLLEYIHKCFGLPEPLLPPTKEELDDYAKSR